MLRLNTVENNIFFEVVCSVLRSSLGIQIWSYSCLLFPPTWVDFPWPDSGRVPPMWESLSTDRGIFTIITLNSFPGRLPENRPHEFVFLLMFYPAPLSEAYSIVWVCQNCFLYFCVRGRLVLFLSLGEMALYKRRPMQSSSELPFITKERARDLLVSR